MESYVLLLDAAHPGAIIPTLETARDRWTQIVEQLGGRLVSLLITTGRWDGVMIIESTDDRVPRAVSYLSALGGVRAELLHVIQMSSVEAGANQSIGKAEEMGTRSLGAGDIARDIAKVAKVIAKGAGHVLGPVGPVIDAIQIGNWAWDAHQAQNKNQGPEVGGSPVNTYEPARRPGAS